MNLKELSKSVNINEIDSFLFYEEIEKIRPIFDSYLEAIAHYCEKNNLDIEGITSILCPQLLEHIKMECMKSKMLHGYKNYSIGILDSLYD